MINTKFCLNANNACISLNPVAPIPNMAKIVLNADTKNLNYRRIPSQSRQEAMYIDAESNEANALTYPSR